MTLFTGWRGFSGEEPLPPKSGRGDRAAPLDGASATRPAAWWEEPPSCKHTQVAVATAADVPRHALKLPAYRGDRPPDALLAQGWMPAETAVQEEEVLKILENLLPLEQQEWEEIWGAPQRRFGQRVHRESACDELSSRQLHGCEKLGAFTAEQQQRLARQGYTEFAADVQKEVFATICKTNLTLHPGRWHLLQCKMAFLGHVMSTGGVGTHPANVAAVKDWPTRTNLSQFRSFLGLASYYWRFVKYFATIASSLHDSTKKGQTFKWDAATERAFAQLWAWLASAPVLDYPDPKCAFILDTD